MINHATKPLVWYVLLILSTLLSGVPCHAQSPMSPEEAFLNKLKLDTLPIEDHSEEFIYRFKRENYKLYKDDEFEMREAQVELVEKTNATDLKKIYSANYTTEFSDFDFDLAGFNFKPIDETTTFDLLDFVFGAKLNTNCAVKLRFLNGSELSFMPLDEEKADMLLKQRKNYKNGKIDRSIHLTIHYVIDGLEKSENISSKTNYTFTAHIMQLDFHDATEGSTTAISSVTSNYKTAFDKKNKLVADNKEMKQKIADYETKNLKTEEELIEEVQSIINNSTLSNELKASLIKTTIELFEASPNTTASK